MVLHGENAPSRGPRDGGTPAGSPGEGQRRGVKFRVTRDVVPSTQSAAELPAGLSQTGRARREGPITSVSADSTRTPQTLRAAEPTPTRGASDERNGRSTRTTVIIFSGTPAQISGDQPTRESDSERKEPDTKENGTKGSWLDRYVSQETIDRAKETSRGARQSREGILLEALQSEIINKGPNMDPDDRAQLRRFIDAFRAVAFSNMTAGEQQLIRDVADGNFDGEWPTGAPIDAEESGEDIRYVWAKFGFEVPNHSASRQFLTLDAARSDRSDDEKIIENSLTGDTEPQDITNPWHDPESLAREIEQKAIPIDYAEIIGDSSVLMLGEQHDHSELRRHIAEHMAGLKAAGITHYAIEALPNQAIDDLNNGDLERDLTGVELGPGSLTRTDNYYEQAVRAAAREGIKIVPIDIDQSVLPPGEEGSVKREEAIADNITSILANNPGAKVAVLIGRYHTMTEENANFVRTVPVRLIEDDISVISAQQHNEDDGPFDSKAACLNEAVTMAGKAESIFMFDLRPYGDDGGVAFGGKTDYILHLPQDRHLEGQVT